MTTSNRGAGSTIQILEQILDDAHLIRIKIEEFDVTGFEVLWHLLVNKGVRLLIVPDDDDRLAIVDNILKQFITSLNQVAYEARTEILIQLVDALNNGAIVVRVDETTKPTKWRAYDDANIYIADETACIIGAPDFIGMSLKTASRGFMVLKEYDEVTQFAEHFDKHFRLGCNINEQLAESLKAFIGA